MGRRILKLLVLLLLPACARSAGDAAIDRSTLRGLHGVAVVIDVLDPGIEKLGVTRHALVAQLLTRLQAGGITIDPGAREFLGLRINTVRGSRGPFALALSLGLYQPVLLSRDHDLHTSTQTWEVESVLMAGPKELLTACSETAEELADRFSAAYHSVNPK